ncbi:hypothetical protein M2427_005192 [Bradyrhizobium sp. BR13661]|jgi:hypothetical protein|nr:hypothetical protein [Bradyrhizobium sp. BR13661]
MGELIPFACSERRASSLPTEQVKTSRASVFQLCENFVDLEQMLELLHSRMVELQATRKSLPLKNELYIQRDAQMIDEIEEAQATCRSILGKIPHHQER